MSFLTLFVVSSLFYIAAANPTKIKECGCKEKMDSFKKNVVLILYSNEDNPVKYKDVIANFEKDFYSIIEKKGIDPDILEQEFRLQFEEISSKASSTTGLPVSELEEILNNFLAKIIHLINSPEYKLLSSKARLAAFVADLKSVIIKAGLNPLNFSAIMENFVEDMLKVVGNTFDPFLLKQNLDDTLADISKLIGSEGITPALLKSKLDGCIKSVSDIIADPEFTKLNVKGDVDNLINDISLAIEGNLVPFMSKYKLSSEEQENFKRVGKDTLISYINYLLFQIIEKGNNGNNPALSIEKEDDILVSFLASETEA